ncbi:CIA30 family protein [Roseobacter ponti]|uniref:NADH:ubiquinone oxidoreductase complex i intermediate-associated protein 30 n=1 Tax=Roseobacter ponti TaxID=1891787 RepID=A0A858SRB9_9RHOB|nr:CIA30 family protein [Roseobacter ponti]QJF50382.1 NADH:ubiquinone oxidoreductase complex i intermediate-associated protein 30 [Roseobacter ponti]
MTTAQHEAILPASEWELVTDGVMGGVSRGALTRSVEDGIEVARLTGDVSLDNNGGFLQMATDIDRAAVTGQDIRGIELSVRGNDEEYEIRLRTDRLNRPWQSFRTIFTATPEWQTLRIGFDAFEPHRTDAPFHPAEIRRIGILAVGRSFRADIALREVRFFGP